MIKALSCFLVITFAVPTHEQNSVPASPCPDLLTYNPTGSKPGRWYGVIHVPEANRKDLRWLNVVLDSQAIALGNWLTSVSSEDNQNFQLGSSSTKFPAGSAQIRFYVQYDPANSPPRVKSISLNGVQICRAAVSDVYKPATEAPTPDRVEYATTQSYTESQQYECGKVVLNNPTYNLLVLNGQPTLEGQWPWQIALYKSEVVDNKFTCGGTLVSRQHVVTAAHCVTQRGSVRPINENSLSVYLGKHNLGSSTEGVQIRLVSTITVHPGFNGTVVAKDLSILTLRDPVSITAWVRPACLWPRSQVDLSYVIGRSGSVVGWGVNHLGLQSEELTLVEMPVVDQETCIRSFSEFFVRFTSEFTLCAGSRDGRSVCNGDSGGGMVFKMGDAWYLRGLVSLSAAKPNEVRCNPMHYVIFTDLAKFLPWIQYQINIY